MTEMLLSPLVPRGQLTKHHTSIFFPFRNRPLRHRSSPWKRLRQDDNRSKAPRRNTLSSERQGSGDSSDHHSSLSDPSFFPSSPFHFSIPDPGCQGTPGPIPRLHPPPSMLPPAHTLLQPAAMAAPSDLARTGPRPWERCPAQTPWPCRPWSRSPGQAVAKGMALSIADPDSSLVSWSNKSHTSSPISSLPSTALRINKTF
jgi:hypothetical protein